jgi:hypothetical protein
MSHPLANGRRRVLRGASVGATVLVVSLVGLGGIGDAQPQVSARAVNPAAPSDATPVVDTGGSAASPLPVHVIPSEDSPIGFWKGQGPNPVVDDTAVLPNGIRLPLVGYDDGHVGLVCQAQGAPVREVTGPGNLGVWDLVQGDRNVHGWVSDVFVAGTANRDFDSDIARCDDATPEVVPAL